MKFQGDGGSRGPEPMAKKEFLKTSLVQKGDFIEAGDRTHGQEEQSWGCEQCLVLYFGAGGSRQKGGPQRDCDPVKQDSEMPEAWLLWSSGCFPSRRH